MSEPMTPTAMYAAVRDKHGSGAVPELVGLGETGTHPRLRRYEVESLLVGHWTEFLADKPGGLNINGNMVVTVNGSWSAPTLLSSLFAAVMAVDSTQEHP